MAAEPELFLMRVLTPEGQRTLLVEEDSYEASQIGRHWNGIKRYRNLGESDDLVRFDGKTVTGIDPDTGLPITLGLAGDPDRVKRWAKQGELDEADPYVELEGGGDA